jgi:hypothetical protein
MIVVCLKQCVNVIIHLQGKENGPRIHSGKGTNNTMGSGSVRENFYLKEVVIYLLRIWIVEGISQISVPCVRDVYLEVMCIRPNIRWMHQNWNAV